jgi:hypothetical protein
MELKKTSQRQRFDAAQVAKFWDWWERADRKFKAELEAIGEKRCKRDQEALRTNSPVPLRQKAEDTIGRLKERGCCWLLHEASFGK